MLLICIDGAAAMQACAISRAIRRFGRPLWAALWLAACLVPAARAGTLTRADIEQRFGPPSRVEDKWTDLPVWPVFNPLEKEVGPALYVFESIDLAPLPGFEGNPMNFLVAIDRLGRFHGVELLSQREPVFTFRDLGGQKDRPLRDFIAQYAGHPVNDQYLIALDAARNRTGAARSRPGQTQLDGISKATTSVRIINQIVLTSALKVAAARLGFGGQRPAAVAPGRVCTDVTESASFDELVAKGVITRRRLSHADVEQLFAGTEAQGLDEAARARPQDTAIELYAAYLNVPTIGRAVLGEATYQALMASNTQGRHLWWIGSSGRDSFLDPDFVPGTPPSRLTLAQDGLFLEWRDRDMEPRTIAGPRDLNTSRILGVNADAGFDPARPADIALTFTRAKGQVFPSLTHRAVHLPHSLPARWFEFPERPLPDWLQAWVARWQELAVIGVALGVLSVVLVRPRWISIQPARLRVFRLGFLVFTLVYLGWHAQGQLSIVQITGVIKALAGGQGVGHLLYDPVSLLLIAFTLVSFVVWGRGAFCGWLCPFGALQEGVGRLAAWLKIPQWKLALASARRLGRLRYAVLAALLAAACWCPTWGERGNEVEPFKTVITLGFDRPWPFVAYAVAVLLFGAVYFKGFCRFLCPLGGAMSVGGRLRRWNWLARREACGAPCRRCESACRYDAIERSGAIRYDDCFQCLDCVGIYHDAAGCVPVMLHARRGSPVPTRPDSSHPEIAS